MIKKVELEVGIKWWAKVLLSFCRFLPFRSEAVKFIAKNGIYCKTRDFNGK